MFKNTVILLTSLLTCSITACSDTPLPDHINTIIVDKCQGCHGDKLEFGAPMKLITWDDTQTTAVTSDRKMWEEMQLRIHDTAQPMPPRGVPALALHEIAILDAWFAEGAPPAEDD